MNSCGGIFFRLCSFFLSFGTSQGTSRYASSSGVLTTVQGVTSLKSLNWMLRLFPPSCFSPCPDFTSSSLLSKASTSGLFGWTSLDAKDYFMGIFLTLVQITFLETILAMTAGL